MTPLPGVFSHTNKSIKREHKKLQPLQQNMRSVVCEMCVANNIINLNLSISRGIFIIASRR